jgi:hypothetical protein
MTTVLVLLSLWAVPIVTFVWARKRAPRAVWRCTGFSLGLVVAPATQGLYGLYFVGPLLALVGLIGLPLASFHLGPGFELATALGLRDPRTVVSGVERVYILVLNAAIWSVVYGALGWLVDVAVGRARHR